LALGLRRRDDVCTLLISRGCLVDSILLTLRIVDKVLSGTLRLHGGTLRIATINIRLVAIFSGLVTHESDPYTS
jgi:hypothetical protein